MFTRSVMSGSFSIPWTVAHQAPLFMGFPRQEILCHFLLQMWGWVMEKLSLNWKALSARRESICSYLQV